MSYYISGEGDPAIDMIPVMIDMPKNVIKYPMFHRLDISLNRTWQVKSGKLTLYLQILNIYNRHNVVYYSDLIENEKKTADPNNPGRIIKTRSYAAKSFNGIPFFPSIGLTYEF